VLNNIHPLAKNFKEIHEAINISDKTKLLKTIVRNRKIFKDTSGNGKSVFDSEKPTLTETYARKEIESLCNELISN